MGQCGRGSNGVCRSREEAFKIGSEIAREVTAANPPPVTLKFEKVYHPCVLLTKKRYVGYMYESPTQVSLHHTCHPCHAHLATCLPAQQVGWIHGAHTCAVLC